MAGFKPIFRKLEKLEVRAERGERLIEAQIWRLEQQVQNLPDSDYKRKLEYRLYLLNMQLMKLAKRAAAEHLLESRKMGSFR